MYCVHPMYYKKFSSTVSLNCCSRIIVPLLSSSHAEQSLGSAELDDNGLGSRLFQKKCIYRSEAGGFGNAPQPQPFLLEKSAMAIYS